jgi:hypothetical protein
MKLKHYLISAILFPVLLFSQSDLQTALKGSELLLSGISIFKGKKGTNINSDVIEAVCVKNKMVTKITYRIAGKSDNGVDVKKELVIQKDGKECFVELPKGTYSYEVELPGKEIYRKGEYKFDDDMVISIKEN